MVEHSGIGTVIRNVTERLLHEFNWHLLVNQDSFERQQWAHNLPFTVLDYPIYSIKEQGLLPFRIPEKTDLTWVPHYNVPVLLRKKFMVTIHDCFHKAFYHTLSLPQRIYANGVMAHAAQGASRITTVSTFSATQITKYTGVPASKIDVIPLAADQLYFSQHYSEEVRNGIRNRYGLTGPYLLFVGNLKPHKNLITLIKAFAQLLADNQELSNYKLVLCGNMEGLITADRGLDQLINQHQLTHAVIKTGFVEQPDLPALIQMASVYVMPSYYEGFGLPVLEAMAAGTPVITSNAASLPEVAGNAALYFDPLDYQALSGQLRLLLGDKALQASLREKGRTHAATFSWDKAATAFEASIIKCL